LGDDVWRKRVPESEPERETQKHISLYLVFVKNKHTHFAVLKKEAQGRIIMTTSVNQP
jgi:hypothetical protein